MRLAFFLPVAVASGFFAFAACSDSVDPIDLTTLRFDTGGQFLLDAPIVVDASCRIEINTVPIAPVTHVPIGTSIVYNSNPPAGGPHYPIWTAYKEFTTPVDPRYWVHNLEHGAVVLQYKCDQADGCPTVVEGLRSVLNGFPDDPICTPLGLRNRIVITPNPSLDVPIAASAWGWTYRAQCLDLASLNAFTTEHYGMGPEVLCNQGQTEF